MNEILNWILYKFYCFDYLISREYIISTDDLLAILIWNTQLFSFTCYANSLNFLQKFLDANDFSQIKNLSKCFWFIY